MDKNKKVLLGLLGLLVVMGYVGFDYGYQYWRSEQINKETSQFIEERKQKQKELISNYMKDYSRVHCCEASVAKSGIEEIKTIKKWEIVSKNGYLFFDVKVDSVDDKGFPVSSLWVFNIEDDPKGRICIRTISQKY